MLFDHTSIVTESEARAETDLGVGFAFQWEEGHLVMDGGTPLEVTGLEAVKAWVELVCRTKAGRYAIYPADFGARAQDLVGRKLPRGVDLSELRRQLEDSARYCPAIQNIGELSHDGQTITGTITLTDGTEIEVNANGT